MLQYNKIIILVIILSIAIAILSLTFVQQKKANQNPIYENQSAGKLLNEQNFPGNSVELSLNSRVSYHEGYSGKAPDQWLSNVLWAAGRAPVTSDPMNIYITTTQGRYHFHPENNSLSNRSSGNSNEAAFVLDYDGELGFDKFTVLHETPCSFPPCNNTELKRTTRTHANNSFQVHIQFVVDHFLITSSFNSKNNSFLVIQKNPT